MGHATFGLRDPEPVEQGREARPFLGLVDRLEVAPEQRHAVGGKRAGKVERVWPPNATTAGSSGTPSGDSASMTLRTLSGSAVRNRGATTRRSQSRRSPGSS